MKKEVKILQLNSVNPKKEPLTVEKLRTFPGFEELNDHDAQETLFAIQTLSTILYEILHQPQQINTEPLKTAA